MLFFYLGQLYLSKILAFFLPNRPAVPGWLCACAVALQKCIYCAPLLSQNANLGLIGIGLF